MVFVNFLGVDFKLVSCSRDFILEMLVVVSKGVILLFLMFILVLMVLVLKFSDFWVWYWLRVVLSWFCLSCRV